MYLMDGQRCVIPAGETLRVVVESGACAIYSRAPMLMLTKAEVGLDVPAEAVGSLIDALTQAALLLAEPVGGEK